MARRGSKLKTEIAIFHLRMRSTPIRTNPGRKIQRKNWLEKGVLAHFKVIRERGV